MLIRTHKTRIYPTASQRDKLSQAVGTSRYVYNWALDTWNKWYEDYKKGVRDDKPTSVKLSALWTQVRPEWAKAVPRSGQDRAIRDVAFAFSMFFRGASKHPTFHKKGRCADTYYVGCCHGKIREDGRHLHLPSIGDMRMAEPLRLSGKIVSYVVSTYAGRWYVAIRVAIEDLRAAPESTCGVDIGMKTPAVCSDGTTLELPKEHLAALDKRLRRASKILSRRTKGSRRREKALIRRQRIQEKINNVRKDRINKFTSAVCKNHATVVIEDLVCSGLHRGPKHIRAGMQRSCMSEVKRQMTYKAINLVKADRWFPSTQLCSNCGSRQKLKLDQRTYKCPHCGLELDRDLNAAINLSHYPGAPGE